MAAGSLTFTTLIALVPLLAVMLAVFTAFPMFGKFQAALQQYLVAALVPEGIAKPVIHSLTQFANKANRVGTAGLLVLVASALSLMLTIDRALNAIWRVRQPRSIAQRVLVYWALATLGPLLLGVSLSLTSYAISANRGLVNALPGGLALLLDGVEFATQALGTAALFYFVPNTQVHWRHALAGGLFVAIGFELAKRGLAWYVGSVASFSAIYGAFATVPIFLLWLYAVWVIVLLGAVVAAYAPSLQMRVTPLANVPGARLGLALAVLAELAQARGASPRGRSLQSLAGQLRIDPLQLEPLVDGMVQADWVARVDEPGVQRYVLLCDPASTPVRPLLNRLLLGSDPRSHRVAELAQWDRWMLAEVLPPATTAPPTPV